MHVTKLKLSNACIYQNNNVHLLRIKISTMTDKNKKLSDKELLFELTRDRAIKYFSSISENDEELNDFIIDAVIDYELRNKPSRSLLNRIVLIPVIFSLLLIALIRQLCVMMRDFILHGGEFIVHKNKRELKTVNEFYREILRKSAREKSKETSGR